MEKWIPSSLLAIGCIFLALAGTNVLFAPSTTPTPQYIETVEHVDFQDFTAEASGVENWAYNDQDAEAPIRAVFVVPGDRCNSCLNDAQSYMEDLQNANLNERSISPLVFFQTLDSAWVRRVAIMHGLEVPIFHGDESVLEGSLSNFGAVSVPCQIVLVDTENNTAFFRVLLDTRHSTPATRRQHYLQQARLNSPSFSG